MSRDRWLVLGQIATGSVSGLIGFGIAYSIFDWIWRSSGFADGGFLYGVLLGATVILTAAVLFVSVGEGVYWFGKFRGKSHRRKFLYKGAFLGTSAAVALMSLTDVKWKPILDRFASPFKLFIYLIEFISIVISLPFKILLLIKFPPVIVFIVAAPIGALIAEKFNLIQPVKEKAEGQKR